MAAENARRHTVVSGVEEDDALQRHGTRLNDVNLESRKAEEASLRRYEGAGWLLKMMGVVGGKDLAVEPSEDEFRIELRSGIILCNVLNKLQPGAVPKVVEGSSDSDKMADGVALSAYQYFENVRNFLVAAHEMGLPTFEPSDLEEGGNCGRIVNCVLALKSYGEWIEGGKHGSWKYGGNARQPASAKPFLSNNSQPSIISLSRTISSSRATDLSVYGDLGCDYNEGGSLHSLNSLLRKHLSDMKPEVVPIVVESLLSKFMERLERRMATQQEAMKIDSGDKAEFETEDSIQVQEAASEYQEVEEMGYVRLEQEECDVEKFKFNDRESSLQQILKQQSLVEQQNGEIQELKKLIHHTKTGIHSLKECYHQDLTNLSNHLQGLASGASAYHRVIEENRKFYNQLQDLKGNIRVCCRVRPYLGGQSNQISTVSNIEEGSVSVISTPPKKGKKIFIFNRVFGPSATQEEVFSDTQPLIRSVLDGYNVCIFAYGQTGSGKTYTMCGPDGLKEENVGVNYRALRDLFLLSGQRKDTFRYEISVQMLEIYNDQVRDLLATDAATNTRLEIPKSGQNGLNVTDANLVPVSSTSDVIYLMNMVQKNRAVSAAAMNDRSSRSHSCMTVYVEGREITSGSIVRGRMHLMELAGSERVDKSEATEERLKEAQHINKSLSALGDVISSLSQKNSHVPYRNKPEALEETISTLKFAERVSTVRLGASRATKDSTEVRELKEQIAGLKTALSRKEREAEQLRHRSYGSSLKQGEKKAASKLKRRSLDLQERNMNYSICGDWVDNLALKRQDGLSSDDNLVAQWEAESEQLSLMCKPSKICMERSIKVTRQDYDDGQENLNKLVLTYDCDELEIVTSDSSESELNWLVDVPKATNISNGSGSKTKKLTQPIPIKNPRIRNANRSRITSSIPLPSRKEEIASRSKRHSSPTAVRI